MSVSMWWSGAVRDYGQPMVDDPARLAEVRGIGLDETTFLLATAVSSTRCVTGVVDVTWGRPARLLNIVDSRAGPALASWLAARDPAGKAQIGFAALDRFRGYADALSRELARAARVLDLVVPAVVANLLATAVSSTRCVTGVVDVTWGRPARLLNIVDSRAGPALASWLAARDPAGCVRKLLLAVYRMSRRATLPADRRLARYGWPGLLRPVSAGLAFQRSVAAALDAAVVDEDFRLAVARTFSATLEPGPAIRELL